MGSMSDSSFTIGLSYRQHAAVMMHLCTRSMPLSLRSGIRVRMDGVIGIACLSSHIWLHHYARIVLIIASYELIMQCGVSQAGVEVLWKQVNVLMHCCCVLLSAVWMCLGMLMDSDRRSIYTGSHRHRPSSPPLHRALSLPH